MNLSNLPPNVTDADIEAAQGDPVTLRKYTAPGGYKFLACDKTCGDSFKEDRAAGLIYGCFDPCNSWEASSMMYRFCAYCKAQEEDSEYVIS